MPRTFDASSPSFLIPLSRVGEPVREYLLASERAGLPRVAAVKVLLDRGVRRGAAAGAESFHPREGGRSCGRCGRAGGAGAARGEDRAEGSGFLSGGEVGPPAGSASLRGVQPSGECRVISEQ